MDDLRVDRVKPRGHLLLNAILINLPGVGGFLIAAVPAREHERLRRPFLAWLPHVATLRTESPLGVAHVPRHLPTVERAASAERDVVVTTTAATSFSVNNPNVVKPYFEWPGHEHLSWTFFRLIGTNDNSSTVHFRSVMVCSSGQ